VRFPCHACRTILTQAGIPISARNRSAATQADQARQGYTRSGDDEGVLDVLGEAVTAERDRRGRRRGAAA